MENQIPQVVVPDTVGPFTTLQQVFDRVWQWAIVEKNPKCGTSAACFYRKPTREELNERSTRARDIDPDLLGSACWIGACIPDSLFEGKNPTGNVNSLIQDYPRIRAHFPGLVDEYDSETRPSALTLGALNALQEIHDTTAPDEWELELRWFARNHGLTVPSAS